MSPTKLTIAIPHDLAVPYLGIYSNEMKSAKTKYSLYIVTLFNMWNEAMNLITGEWTKRIWHMYTVEYYAAMKNNEILLFVAKRMELKGIVLSEISHAHKDKYCMISFISETYKTKN